MGEKTPLGFKSLTTVPSYNFERLSTDSTFDSTFHVVAVATSVLWETKVKISLVVLLPISENNE
jgi:hypothetical protein